MAPKSRGKMKEEKDYGNMLAKKKRTRRVNSD